MQAGTPSGRPAAQMAQRLGVLAAGARQGTIIIMTSKMARRLLGSFLGLSCGCAAATDASVRLELQTLLTHLGTSSCHFNRNGEWHAAKDAQEHLLQKLNYIEARRDLKNTEEFIELAASTSSMSGQPYLVRCASAAPVHSAVWLRARLAQMRAASTAPRAP